MWHLMGYIKQQIHKLGGSEVYQQYGQPMVDYVVDKCTMHFGTAIVKYPDDEEIIETINYFSNKKQYCPECGTELECMNVIDADEALSGKTERLWLCHECLSSWQTIEQDDGSFDIQRHFFG